MVTSGDVGSPPLTTYDVDPEGTGILVEARSSVGPITFASSTLTGTLVLRPGPDGVDLEEAPQADLALPMTALASGNSLYDVELRRRLDARHFPEITATLRHARRLGPDRYAVDGDLTIHGTTRRLPGAVSVTLPDAEHIVVVGEHQIDIRDFDIAVPSVLMLKIYPDVQVSFRVTAVRRNTPGADGGQA